MISTLKTDNIKAQSAAAVAAFLVITLVFALNSSADTIELKNGKEIVGDIIKETGEAVIISKLGGELKASISRDRIRNIRRSKGEGLLKRFMKRFEREPAALQDEPASAGDSTNYLLYEGEKVRVDIYNPGYKSCPVVILVHGGAGIKGDRAIRYRNFALDLKKHGIIAINVHYFECKKRKMSRIKNGIYAVKKTMDVIPAIPNADKDRIGIVGYSVGGNVVLRAGSQDNRVKAVAASHAVSLSGVSKRDVAKLPATYIICGSKDKSAMKVYGKLKQWFSELGKPFKSEVGSHGHNDIPMPVFEAQWDSIVGFFDETL
ncbi:alpha/beta hydrolase [Candidatus Omnitrophota bacterium]